VPTPIRVVAALIQHSNTVLIAKRRLSKARGGFWELPGGKVEPGESDEQALVREIKEELGIEIEITSVYGQTEYMYPELTIDLIGYRCRIVAGEPVCREHEQLRWVASEDLCMTELAPADKSLLRC
jgi:8-oxo-dGTP diphosphatase